MDKTTGMLSIFTAILALSSTYRVSSLDTPAPAPGPAAGASCEDVIYDMMDCVTYISEGSSSKLPSTSCCSGVKSVMDFSGKCICVAIESSAQLGIQLNMTRVEELPSLCKLKPYPLGECGCECSYLPFQPPSPSSSPSPKVPDTPKPMAPAPSLEPPAEAPKSSGFLNLARFSLATISSVALAVCYSMLA
ncbi:hypothetical protein SAY86_032158 [Trapa natans]|uniref:Bifunctional inhibitor/plant lipid transfer protein/seed storage helical domain-containing protein n=1 Tax=Trapa natans TaxID=22666 RepID=A0AAN7LT24_TRANT|nr:hypothetical protein SAY86_032158 [Trapa natans]